MPFRLSGGPECQPTATRSGTSRDPTARNEEQARNSVTNRPWSPESLGRRGRSSPSALLVRPPRAPPPSSCAGSGPPVRLPADLRSATLASCFMEQFAPYKIRATSPRLIQFRGRPKLLSRSSWQWMRRCLMFRRIRRWEVDTRASNNNRRETISFLLFIAMSYRFHRCKKAASRAHFSR
jgi:hypothetical protein